MNQPLPFIQNLLDDPLIAQIMVDGWQQVYVEKEGNLIDVPTPFSSDDDVFALLCAIAELPFYDKHPIASFRLSDFTRVEAVLPPIAISGPSLLITKPPIREITLDNLLEWGAITQEAADYLKACVQARLNIAIVGGTASGKSQFLRIMVHWIPLDERVVFLQVSGRPNLPHKRLVVLETRPPDLEGKNGITMLDLVQAAQRMRPDRLVVNEVNGAEMLDLLQMMNAGLDGGLFTIHADGPRAALTRIERMAGLGNPELTLRALREQITSAIDIMVTIERMRDGSRKIAFITELIGMEDGLTQLMDIFVYSQTGYENNRVIGSLRPTGIKPKSLDKLEHDGFHLPMSTFGIGTKLPNG